MRRSVVVAVGQARDLVRLVLCAALTLLFAAITVRFALSGGGMEIVFLAVPTVALVFLTRRCYRRLRGSAGGNGEVGQLP